MREGTANSSERLCPACGQQAGRDRGRKNNFQLLSCRTCATLYTAQNPDAGQGADYDAYYTFENLAVPAFISGRLDEIVATFEPYRKSNRLLDVGCGAGSFLEAAARNNWEAFGAEISQTSAEHVRSKGFEVFCGELEQSNYADQYFDVVIASEVLEHVADPRGLLTAITRVLRPGGLLWATTPHGRGLSARLLGLQWSIVCPPEHLQLFSIQSTQQLLVGAGFRRVRIATHGTNPFEIFHEISRRLRRGPESEQPATDFNRVESNYQLNESLGGNYSGRLLKRMVNGLLNAARIGDSLKIVAEKR